MSADAEQAALEHAWQWFALHARQRMQCVNFFLVAVAFLAAAFVTGLKDDYYAVAALVGSSVHGSRGGSTDWTSARRNS